MIKTLSYAVTGQRIEVTETAMLVAGTVNIYTAIFAFDEAWDGLQRTAVFAVDGITREQLLEDDACTVPWEVLVAGNRLRVGVYGTKADGTRLPTIWTERRLYINPGAGPTQEAADPSPTLVEQLLGRIGDPANLKTEDKSSLVAAINEVWSSGGGGGSSVTDAAINEDGHLIITLSSGKAIDAGRAVGAAGAGGKSAYEYAVDGGYTGTEAEFAAKLAAEIPAVDDTLTASGKAADAAAVGARLSSLSEEKADKEYISLKKYGITAVDYEAPFTTEMYEVAYANGKGFQKAIDDAKANGRKAIVIPQGNYPLCWAGGESEANPVIVSEGVDIYGNDSRLYVIFDEGGINPYFTGEKPYRLFGTVIATDSSVYDLNIEGERQYRVTSPGWQDNSCGIGLTGNSHNNVIQNCTIKHISGDGIGCRNLGVQLATWTDTFAALGWNGSTYVASTKMYRSTRHGVGFIADMSAPHLINSVPNFMWSTEPFIIRFFDGETDDDLGNMLGVVRVHGMQYFYFPEGTKSWYIELTREVEHAEDATESWRYFLRQAYYSGTQIIGCELCYNQRGGMSNLPDSAVIRNCRVHNNGNAVNGMVDYYDATRFGLDQEEVVIGSLTIEDSLFYGTNAGVYYKSWSIVLKNSKFYGDVAGVRSLNGAVDFMAINCDFVSDHPIYGGACILTGAAEFGEKTMIGCRVVGRISDSITVFGGDMSKAKPVYADSDGNYVASNNYVWIGNDGKMLPSGGGINITGAKVGQIARISEVDENGTPTVWEPVDLPTGGASSTEEWVQIADYTWTAEDAAQTGTIYFSYDNDINGNPLSIDAIWIIYTALTEANRQLYFKLGTDNFNKNYIGSIANALKNNKTLYVYAEMFPNPKHAIIDYSFDSTMYGGTDVTRKLWVPQYDSSFVFPATGLTIFSGGALLEGSNFKVFGRKKNA